MAYTPGFDYDIFISYAHIDNRSDRWLSRFISDLKNELRARLGRDVSVYLDTASLAASDDFQSKAIDSVRRSATFLPLVSPNYLKSRWALTELEAFLGTNRPDSVVPIEILPVEEQQLSETTETLARRTRFWFGEDIESQSVRRLMPDTETEALYHERLHQIVEQIAARLKPTRPLVGLAEGPPIYGARADKRFGGTSMEKASMEEILASIGRIIADDDAARSTKPEPKADLPPVRPVPRPSPAAPSCGEPAYCLDLDESVTGPVPAAQMRILDAAESIEQVGRKRDVVEFAVSTPLVVKRGVPFLVDAWAFLPQDMDAAVGRAREAFGKDAPFRSGGSATVARGTRLKVELQAGPWSVEPKFQTIVWAGYVTNASFRVRPDAEVPSGRVQAVCKISLRGKRIGEIHFDFTFGEKQGKPIMTAVKRLNVFASYASKDRTRVLATVQGIEKFADVFLDVRNLKSGEPYPARLLQKIDASDVLYLFWSRHAQRSEWVDREWRYGYERRGIDFIDPVPLVNPREVPPPPELSDEKHFDDWTLAFMEYEKSLSIWHRLRSWWGADWTAAHNG